MGRHTVYHEDIQTIALMYGFSDWHAIWDHPENAELRRVRTNPLLLVEGDEVFYPDDIGLSFDASTGSRIHIQLPADPPQERLVTLVLHDFRGHPFVQKRFTLEYPVGTMEGMTSERGEINCSIPFNHNAPILTIYPKEGNERLKITWPLQLGWLEPVDTVAGIRARLRNLGYKIDTVDNSEGTDLHNAIRLFRGRYQLPVNHEIDSEFRRQLQEAHGGT